MSAAFGRRAELAALVALCIFLPLYEAPKNLAWAAYVLIWLANRLRTRDFGGAWGTWDTLIALWIASVFVVAPFAAVHRDEWRAALDVLRYGRRPLAAEAQRLCRIRVALAARRAGRLRAHRPRHRLRQAVDRHARHFAAELRRSRQPYRHLPRHHPRSRHGMVPRRRSGGPLVRHHGRDSGGALYRREPRGGRCRPRDDDDAGTLRLAAHAAASRICLRGRCRIDHRRRAERSAGRGQAAAARAGRQYAQFPSARLAARRGGLAPAPVVRARHGQLRPRDPRARRGVRRACPACAQPLPEHAGGARHRRRRGARGGADRLDLGIVATAAAGDR